MITTFEELAEVTGIKPKTLYNRSRSMPIEQAAVVHVRKMPTREIGHKAIDDASLRGRILAIVCSSGECKQSEIVKASGGRTSRTVDMIRQLMLEGFLSGGADRTIVATERSLEIYGKAIERNVGGHKVAGWYRRADRGAESE